MHTNNGRIRTVNLDEPPEPSEEVRLELDDCTISIWLPANAGTLGKAMSALADAGFDVPDEP